MAVGVVGVGGAVMGFGVSQGASSAAPAAPRKGGVAPTKASAVSTFGVCGQLPSGE